MAFAASRHVPAEYEIGFSNVPGVRNSVRTNAREVGRYTRMFPTGAATVPPSSSVVRPSN